jgi:hypothetical protein
LGEVPETPFSVSDTEMERICQGYGSETFQDCIRFWKCCFSAAEPFQADFVNFSRFRKHIIQKNPRFIPEKNDKQTYPFMKIR